MPYSPGTNTGHGHVWARPDGMKARCGGSRFCKVCSADFAARAAYYDQPKERPSEREADRERAPIPIPLLLSRHQAYLMAQMCKRFSYSHAASLVEPDEREDLMRAIGELEKILTLSLGFKVR